MDDQRLRYLTAAEAEAVEEFLNRLRERYGDRVMQVILFGSKARGDSEEESDIDLLVVLDDGDWRLRDEVGLIAFEPMLDHDVVISPMVVNQEHYQWLQSHRTPLYRNWQEQGIDLWTRIPRFSSASV